MTMIKEINHIIEFDKKNFLPRVIRETEALQKKGLEVEIQYAVDNDVYSAMLIGRKEDKKNGSSKTL